MFRAEQFACETADDRDLAAQVLGDRVQAAAREVHHRHRILH